MYAAVAHLLGIDTTLQPEYTWILVALVSAPLPPGWAVISDSSGKLSYRHDRLKLAQPNHPLTDQFRRLLSTQLAFAKDRRLLTGSQRCFETQEQLTSLIKDCLNRGRSGSLPVEPSHIEQLCTVCYVDSSTQFRQAHALKQALESYIDKELTLTTLVGVAPVPQELLAQSQAALSALVISDSAAEILICQECSKSSAKLKCDQCKDFFCHDCFKMTHATGKRKTHATLKIDQTACTICDASLAAVSFGEPPTLSCDPCFKQLVLKNPEISNFPRKLLYELKCSECQADLANLVCEDCCDLFCLNCHLKHHLRGKRQYHMIVTIDAGLFWRSGRELSPAQSLTLLDACNKCANEYTEWLAFVEGFWYNLVTKMTTTVKPIAIR
jgi:hypothetical protein